ncbi:MAG: hypothetical protein PUK75_06640 [bacterium]|nr:hypothetical protein [bacterium]MDY4099815.1 hypothetical protein [Lachnospiraceae bacterium]
MNIAELYKIVFSTCVEFAVYQKDVVSNVEQMLPMLNELGSLYFTENYYRLDEEDYHLVQMLLTDILKDITQGLEQQDRVLLEDTLEYGLLKFLEIFLEDDEILALKEACVIEP